jgi:nucleoside-diphosphate-sugar epimerase
MARSGEDIEVWGDGEQTRSFLYIDECVEGTVRLLRSNFAGPVNIGSEEMVTINELVDLVADIAGKAIGKKHVPGPLGVRGRNSDNRLIEEKLCWQPSQPLRVGLEPTYQWIERQIMRNVPSNLAPVVDGARCARSAPSSAPLPTEIAPSRLGKRRRSAA